MKVAVGMRNSEEILDKEYLRFLRQIGVTHVIAFMPDRDLLPSAAEGYWSEDDLRSMVRHYNENGLEVEGIENFLPRHWNKILLDMPGKEKQLENIKRTIIAMGKAKIPNMGYNFSVGGVIGRHHVPYGRAGALVDAFDPETLGMDDSPIPRSMVWNRVVDPEAKGVHPYISREEMKERLYWFLEKILPVAEEANVRLAAHPEDPPIPVMRHAGRVLINPAAYDEMFEKFPSYSCAVEFCQGTFTEMGVDIYQTIKHFAKQGRIGYVHFRNVRGTIPKYNETIIDDGDVDMAKALLSYYEAGYDGALIPDHYPTFAGVKSSHATVAYSIGHIRGIMKAVGIPIWGES